jgi:hypothetical protein
MLGIARLGLQHLCADLVGRDVDDVNRIPMLVVIYAGIVGNLLLVDAETVIVDRPSAVLHRALCCPVEGIAVRRIEDHHMTRRGC